MTYAAVTSLKGTLHLHFLQSQPRFPLQYKQQIVSLHENLGFIQQVLEKSEIAYGNDNSAMKDLEAQIRDVAFKAEERIELELTTIYLAKGWTKRLLIKACLLRLHGIFIQAVIQTDYLKNKFVKVSKKQLAKGPSQGVRMRQSGLLHGSTSSQPDLERENNITVSKFYKNASIKLNSGMVGCNKEFKTIMDKLTRQSAYPLQVVSIVGMGGIGKTTLARKLYEDSSITSHFDKRAWVTVSQQYNVEQMLQCLIDCVNAASNDNLADTLRKHLLGQRYLIVMDDIWSTTVWDSMKRCFPDDNNGSRILLTSRLREVVEYAGNSTINMPFLDANESWNLYCNVFGQTEFLLVFEKIGRDIVKKCNGLPLAIIVVASLLSKTEAAVEKWNNVVENVSRYVIGDSDNACSRILYLSYNQLPHHLKACFLYFGVFPEDYEIHVKKLVRLWVAEGFLRVVDHQNMEEVAMECLQDLVDRSLVLVGKQSYNGKIKTIMMHDLLRDLCLREARRENLLNVNGNDYDGVVQHLFPGKACPLISINIHYNIKVFCHFKLLRALDMKLRFWRSGDKVLYIENLVHLRYFALSICFRLCALKLKFSEHWNMQSFIVHGSCVILDSSRTSSIWKMPLLRNFSVEENPLTLEASEVVHKNIETIFWLRSECCKEDIFTRIPNLKKLGIQGGIDSENENSDDFYNVVHLGQLEKLSIKGWHLELRESGIQWATSFLPNLKKLKFFETRLPWSNMRLIGMLPNLEVLKLKGAYPGKIWEPSEGGFRQLKRLVLGSKYLQYWNVVGDPFPVLEHLELSDCDLLRKIPIKFADITTLALIQLNKCCYSVLVSAWCIQDEQRRYGNDGLCVRSKHTKVSPIPNGL